MVVVEGRDFLLGLDDFLVGIFREHASISWWVAFMRSMTSSQVVHG